MKKVTVAALFAVPLTMAAALPAEASLLLQSHVAAGADLQHIAPFIIIKSDNSTPTDISGSILTYYIYIGRLPIGWATPTVTTLQGTPGATASVSRLDKAYASSIGGGGKFANFVVRIVVPPNTFVRAGVPGGPPDQNYEISLSLTDNSNPHNNFDQTDDYSYLSQTTYGSNPFIMMQNSSLGILWGGPITHDRPTQLALAKQKIQHVIIIMQENRSFDSYFGTFVPNNLVINALGAPYGGVDGIANAPNGTGDRDAPAPCSGRFDPGTLTATVNTPPNAQVLFDLPHFMPDSKTEMGCTAAGDPGAPSKACSATGPLKIKDFLQVNGNAYSCNTAALTQTVGHYTGNASTDPLFNHWTIAKNFILQDKMFEPLPSWSKMSHIFMVSGWSANCTAQPCSPLQENYQDVGTPYAWGDISTLLANVAPSKKWGYYKGENWNYNCGGSGATETCKTNPLGCFNQNPSQASIDIWNPLPNFVGVQQKIQQGTNTGTVQPLQNFLTAVTNGCPTNCTDATVPSVSWIVPAIAVSEHDSNINQWANPPFNIANVNLKAGESYVTMLIQQIMKNTALWNSSVIFLAWDDWGGYYDHVRPPKDSSGQLMYGMRVPAIAISPWVNNGGTLDHQTLSFDAYLKLIEDLFMPQGTRLGGDGRTSVRENEPQLGDLLDEFDFRRNPLAAPSQVTTLSCQAQ